MPHAMPFVMIKLSVDLGRSCITSLEGANDAKAMAAKVSMIRLIHKICVTVNGSSVPNNDPPNTNNNAVTFTTSWKKRNRWIFLYSERPHITASAMLRKESSNRVISLASFATLVPLPNDNPTWAWCNAGASFVPSPVTATT